MRLCSSRASVSLALVAALFLVACGDDADNGDTPDAAVADSASIDLAAEDGPVVADVIGADLEATDTPGPRAVKVTYQGNTTTVVLSQVTPIDFRGEPHARLSEVILIALPDKAQDTLAADFVGSDGFKSSMDSGCVPLIPYPGDNFDKGYIDLSTYRLHWEADLALPGCMSVKNLAEILLSDK